MPKFSVIVPIYKVEDYLVKCVDSILAQTFQDFELILVDDGSPDNCPAICDEYAEKDGRVKVVHKLNGGVVSARIVGTEIATGDYICCIDGDDWIHPKYLEKFFEAIAETKPDMVCCGCFSAFDDGANNISKAPPYSAGYYDREGIIKKFFPILIEDRNNIGFLPQVWAKAIKRELFISEQSAVSPKIKMGEDNAVIIPCLYKSNSLFILNDCLYYYRQVATSITKTKKALDWDGPYLRYQHRNNRINLSEFDFKEQQYRGTVHSLFTVVVSQFYRKESYRVIVKDIKTHLQNEVYKEAIHNCKFCSLKGRFATFALKYQAFCLIWLYSRIK